MGRRTRNRVIDKDRNYRRFLKRLGNLGSGGSVSIGLFAEDREGDGPNAAQVGAFNEFGTVIAPQRPFLAPTFDAKKTKYTNSLARVVRQLLITGRGGTLAQKLAVVGSQVQADVQIAITKLKRPANTASTIASKGSDNPLVDTGTMRRQVRFKVKT